MQVQLKLLTLGIVLALTSCGGETIQVAEGGIGGSGITIGRITGFGSIIVNGVKFDVKSSSFNRDGTVSTGQKDFSIGEVVTITGTVNTDGVTGTASNVNFIDILEGPVTANIDANNSFEVLGQRINTDNQTKLYGITTLADLKVGDIFEVSGFVNSSEEVLATSIKLKTSTKKIEVKGIIDTITPSAKTFIMNNLLVDYSRASLKDFTNISLSVGQFIEVSGKELQGITFIATEIELKKTAEINSNTEVEIEGVVTRFNSITDFEVNGYKITTNSKTNFKKNAQSNIGINSIVEIKGVTDSTGTLVATKVSIEKTKEKIKEKTKSDSSDDDSDDD